MKERWKRIVYKKSTLPYEVSNQGRIRRIPGPDTGGHIWPQMIMKQHFHPNGYRQVCLRWIGKHGRQKKIITVHTLVAFAFLKSPPGKYGRGKIGINHKNCVKSDNRIENLKWATYRENSFHAIINGRMKRGEDNPNSIFSNSDVIEIRHRFDNGESIRSLARSYNCSRPPIKMICHRLTWTHI